ncbi:MAG: 16S rRNA (cytidine(1402)-2'-O)-methyltransferase [Duncaniella sp.]|nr:16S rRNA (cytidine(1402)-2'-O)-methyltransferase [Duncaniella sp.]
MSTLYIVPTPVGNLADMTPRAVEVLQRASLILAEDTRTSAPLLRHFGIDTPCVSHHKYNEHATVAPLIDRMAAGETIALISDAGTPGISDPGFLLSRECRRAGIDVITLPGATAFVPALVSSGLPCDRFTFEGFLPPKKGRRTRLEQIASSDCTSIIYESPLRLVKTLGQLMEVCGPDREASVSREISKVYEETCRDTLAGLQEYFTQNNPRGEIVIIVAPAPQQASRVHVNKYRDPQ